ncbi:hypothetical protein M0R45_021195 [Rubus argutus]|uniref:Stress-response A/B barrel domain-containing protein n=1 Tax=Rubus argutus TaxID=59490 RepID=A0AAW1XCY6_RUBAR
MWSAYVLISFYECFVIRGKDVSIEYLHQGFTYIFESTFKSTEGVAEYIAHPAHLDFANLFLSHLEKVLVFDYKPTTVRV